MTGADMKNGRPPRDKVPMWGEAVNFKISPIAQEICVQNRVQRS